MEKYKNNLELNKALAENERLIYKIVRTYELPKGIMIGFEDMLQAGRIGFVEGYIRYDSTNRCKLSTYVTFWIKKYIGIEIRKTNQFYASESVKNKYYNILELVKAGITDHEEIAKILGIKKKDVLYFLNNPMDVSSLDRCDNADDKPPLEFIGDERSYAVRSDVMNKAFVKMAKLLENDRRSLEMLKLRYGIDSDGKGLSNREIGLIFGLSCEAVRKKIEKARGVLQADNELMHIISQLGK